MELGHAALLAKFKPASFTWIPWLNVKHYSSNWLFLLQTFTNMLSSTWA